MNPNKTDADSGAFLSDAGLGRIAYEAAAAATGCTQPWEEANQAKWDAAALAVADACEKICDEVAKDWNNFDDVTADEIKGRIKRRSNVQGQGRD